MYCLSWRTGDHFTAWFLSFYGIQLLGEIEEHLNCTITQVEPDIKVPVDDFDGKVTYGKRRAAGGKWTTIKNPAVFWNGKLIFLVNYNFIISDNYILSKWLDMAKYFSGISMLLLSNFSSLKFQKQKKIRIPFKTNLGFFYWLLFI